VGTRVTRVLGRVIAAGAAGVLALSAGLACAVPAQAATNGRIDYGAQVNLRSGPGTQYTLAGHAADGQAVTIVCTASSQPVEGKRGTTAIWDRLGSGLWVAHAFVLVNGVDRPEAECPAAGQDFTADDYPYLGTTNVVDRWAMYTGQCTSWVAWRMEQVNGYFNNNMWRNGVQGHWGNADNWVVNAKLLGYPVDDTPKVGAIAQWNPGASGASTHGHVAYISAVRGQSVTVQEYNWSTALAYDTRTVPVSQLSNVIHLAPGT
jgi:surface antigen